MSMSMPDKRKVEQDTAICTCKTEVCVQVRTLRIHVALRLANSACIRRTCMYLFVCLFGVYRPTREFSHIWRLHHCQ